MIVIALIAMAITRLTDQSVIVFAPDGESAAGSDPPAGSVILRRKPEGLVWFVTGRSFKTQRNTPDPGLKTGAGLRQQEGRAAQVCIVYLSGKLLRLLLIVLSAQSPPGPSAFSFNHAMQRVSDMTKLTISDDMRKALISAASTNTIDGPIGRTIAVIRTGLDRTAKYDGGNHRIWCGGRWTTVAKAVDCANDFLASVGLGLHRIDYPGARFESQWLHGANDNFAAGFARADAQGGV